VSGAMILWGRRIPSRQTLVYFAVTKATVTELAPGCSPSGQIHRSGLSKMAGRWSGAIPRCSNPSSWRRSHQIEGRETSSKLKANSHEFAGAGNCHVSRARLPLYLSCRSTICRHNNLHAFQTDDPQMQAVSKNVFARERLNRKMRSRLSLRRNSAIGWLANIVRERMHGNVAYLKTSTGISIPTMSDGRVTDSVRLAANKILRR